MGGLAALALAATALAGAVPAPEGPYAVGTRLLALPEPGRRALVQAWYPAAGAHGPKAPYLPERVARSAAASGGVPVTARAAHANAVLGPRPRAGAYPAVLFSPGYGEPHGLYTALLEDLASR